MMKTLSILTGIAALTAANAAVAHDTQTPFPSRGACEAASAQMSKDEKDWVLNTFPDLFASSGEVASFLTRAWTCDRNESDGQYYITDHVADALNSDWYAHRNR